MSDPMSRFESLVDQQIREAQERGDFDNLPGAGKPLPGWGTPDDEQWWLKQYVQREGLPGDELLPNSLRLAKEIELLPERVAELLSEQAVREHVRDLNQRIAAHLRAPTGPPVPVRPVNIEEMVRHWRDAWQLDTAPPAEQPAPPASPPRRRWFGRRR